MTKDSSESILVPLVEQLLQAEALRGSKKDTC